MLTQTPGEQTPGAMATQRLYYRNTASGGGGRSPGGCSRSRRDAQQGAVTKESMGDASYVQPERSTGGASKGLCSSPPVAGLSCTWLRGRAQGDQPGSLLPSQSLTARPPRGTSHPEAHRKTNAGKQSSQLSQVDTVHSLRLL